MPETSTGGAGDRADTRSPGDLANNVRIDVNSNMDVTFTSSDGTFYDRVANVTMAFNEVTYRTDNGYLWSVPRTWRSGDTVPRADIRWTNPATGYVRGGYVPNTNVALPGGYIEPARFVQTEQGGCPCDMCRQRRAQSFETPDQRARRMTAEQEAIERARVERQAKEAAADARAEETLRMVLRPKELAHYDGTGEIIITGADGNRYLIDNGVVSNVHLLAKRGNRKLVTFCCHPKLWENDTEMLPYKDAHIGQILYLRHDLDRFYKKANKYWHDLATRDEYLGRTGTRGTREDRALRRDAW